MSAQGFAVDIKRLLQLSAQVQRRSNGLPSTEGDAYARGFEAYNKQAEFLRKRMGSTLDKISAAFAPDSPLSLSGMNSTKATSIQHTVTVSDVQHVVDDLIERVDRAVDSSRGVGAPAAPPTGSKPFGSGLHVPQGLTKVRVQDLFEQKVDNTAEAPWLPSLKEKPNAVVPLSESMHPRNVEKQRLTDRVEDEAPSGVFYHPYMAEVDALKYQEWMVEKSKPELFRDPKYTTCTWVDTPGMLDVVAHKLSQETMFAIDLEAHSFESYQGITCLMQLSTRSEDYIVDCIRLRSHMHVLQEPFTNPKIVKVTHGGKSDIPWLQRDFSLYVVNLFDTYHACVALKEKARSLAHLLKTYCDVSVNKKYQLEDWRVRPLSAEMIAYARGDTHYLLYLYDVLKNALIDQGGLAENHNVDSLRYVLDSSNDWCKLYHSKSILDQYSHGIAIRSLRRSRCFNAAERKVFAAVHAWRDLTCRATDFSTGAILPNRILSLLAEGHAQVADGRATSLIRFMGANRGHVHPVLRSGAAVLASIISSSLVVETAEEAFELARDTCTGAKAPVALVPQTPLKSKVMDTPARRAQVLGGIAAGASVAEAALHTPKQSVMGGGVTGYATDPAKRAPAREMFSSPVWNSSEVFEKAGWLDSSAGAPKSTIPLSESAQGDNEDVEMDAGACQGNRKVVVTHKGEPSAHARSLAVKLAFAEARSVGADGPLAQALSDAFGGAEGADDRGTSANGGKVSIVGEEEAERAVEKSLGSEAVAAKAAVGDQVPSRMTDIYHRSRVIKTIARNSSGEGVVAMDTGKTRGTGIPAILAKEGKHIHNAPTEALLDILGFSDPAAPKKKGSAQKVAADVTFNYATQGSKFGIKDGKKVRPRKGGKGSKGSKKGSKGGGNTTSNRGGKN